MECSSIKIQVVSQAFFCFILRGGFVERKLCIAFAF